MLKITHQIQIDEAELKVEFTTSPGPGGQNVNKLATAAVLRFNALQSPSLPQSVRDRLLAIANNKINKNGEIIIKAFRYRSQERNKQDAIERLQLLLKRAAFKPKTRRETKPTKASVKKRLEKKKIQGKTKLLRSKKQFENE